MRTLLFLFASTLLLTGCESFAIFGSDDSGEVKLSGERLSVLQLEKDLLPEDSAISIEGLKIPEAWKNAFWPQAGGYPNHAMKNLALNTGKLERLWRADIGRGADGYLPLTAQPISVHGSIYTVDSTGQLSSFNADDGEDNWRITLLDTDLDDPVIGGGIAYANDRLFATNGYDEVMAINPQDGATIWRVQIPTPSRAAPTLMDGRVFVTTLDNRLLALDADNGALLWEHSGVSESAGLVGAASAAANHDIVVPAFSSGEIFALRVENGSVAWSDDLSNSRGFGSLSGLADIKALPVLDRGLVIAMSFSGRLIAIDERTGTRVWKKQIGGTNTPWVAGDLIYVLSSDNQLIALERTTGSIVWVRDIYVEDNVQNAFRGPVMAGGRLVIAGREGRVIEIDATSGATIRDWEVSDDVNTPPMVANEVLYILDDSGTLYAYK